MPNSIKFYLNVYFVFVCCGIYSKVLEAVKDKTPRD